MWKKCRELFVYREMIKSLVRRDLRGRYKSSVLGFLWTFINPLCQIIVYTVVFSNIFRMGIERYYLFLTVVMIPWVFFSSSLSGGAMAVVSQQDLVKKIYFPREVLPISFVTSCFINMLLSMAVVFLVIVCSGNGLCLYALLYLPAVMLVEYILCLGFAMVVSACTVYFRDLEHIMGVLMMAWIYLTPVMYDISFIPENLLPVFRANPMTPVAAAYRDILYYKQAPDMQSLLTALFAGVLALFVGGAVFGRLQKNFVEEL
ncbi:MAG: ABC transporter permease [Eubacterium sp.]|nr:ABC transporter permease [Eubacterium sp.]